MSPPLDSNRSHITNTFFAVTKHFILMLSSHISDSVAWYISAKIGEAPAATNIRTLMREAAGPSAIFNRYQTTRHQIPDSDVHIS
jgi:hypothetical protein